MFWKCSGFDTFPVSVVQDRLTWGRPTIPSGTETSLQVVSFVLPPVGQVIPAASRHLRWPSKRQRISPRRRLVQGQREIHKDQPQLVLHHTQLVLCLRGHHRLVDDHRFVLQTTGDLPLTTINGALVQPQSLMVSARFTILMIPGWCQFSLLIRQEAFHSRSWLLEKPLI